MVEIDLYNCSAENNMLDKRPYLSLPSIYNCNLIEDTSILTPELLISGNAIGNYVYIPAFKRYYYVIDRVHETNNLVRLYLKVDTLMSYSRGIRNLTAFIDRNEHTYSKNVIDDKIVVELGQDVTVEDCGGANWFTVNSGYTFTVTGFGLSSEPIQQEEDT